MASSKKSTDPKTKKAPAAAKTSLQDGSREIVESVVIALVLAFLFRTFEAEAFVIPTGSMATTLMGRHKDLECVECGYPYRVSASQEVNSDTNAMKSPGEWVAASTCPNCRFSMLISADPEDNPQDKSYDSYKGDRILVSKAAYDWSEPRRWDVIVFRYPKDAKTNYIKRLVGLPGEKVQIFGGDVYTRKAEENSYQIAHKTPDKVLAMRQIVYDNDYVVGSLLKEGWPARWQPDSTTNGGWTSTDETKTFSADGTGDQEHWLHYQHFVPTPADWQALETGPLPKDRLIEPQLVTDFTAYNSGRSRGQVYTRGGIFPYPDRQELGWHWAGDLTLECEAEIRSDQGQLILELVEGKVAETGQTARFRCTLDIATGEAKLSIQGLDSYTASAKNVIAGPGTYTLRFANVDDQLYLWVDGSVVTFDKDTTYPRLGNHRPYREDLKPVGIATRGTDATVRDLKIYRDIYYSTGSRESGVSRIYGDALIDFAPGFDPASRLFPIEHRNVSAEFYSSPQYWDSFDHLQATHFDLEQDQFFVLGDNSAQSQDGRLWDRYGNGEYFVAREMLIGKAIFIYWPHSLDYPVPFTPNIKRMGFVR